MTVAARPTVSTGFDAWLEDRAASDTGPTHRVAVELRFEIDVSVPPETPDHDIGEAVLAVISRFDRDALLERVDYEVDRLLPDDLRLVGATARLSDDALEQVSRDRRDGTVQEWRRR